ncbi:VAO-type flavoprotein oxidase [Cladobotryum mycophilum]|uniref:VAO-type flavoprotein oxidase n=1 Tax=Cladobotryum mycophilum TaxID=491253 RepID=A0ABR0STH4_9HYPO
MSSQYVNDACLPYPTLSCSPMGYPEYVINATTPSHVKLGIEFARKHNLRLVIKSTGHDFLGRSTAPNSLSVWTHNMDSIKSHNDDFQPRGCGIKVKGSAVTLGAGVEMQDAFTHLGVSTKP